MASIRRRTIEPPLTISGFCSRRFAELRLAANVPMHVVADNAGLSLGFVCDFENGVRGISVENWCLLIMALEKDPDMELRRAIAAWEDHADGH